MPVETIYLKDGGVLVKGVGIVTGDELIACLAEIYETPAKIKAIRYQLGDFTEADKVAVSGADVQQMAAQDKEASAINPDMLIATVGSTTVLYGLSRMWELYVAETLETHVFRTVEEAQKWLWEQLKENQS